MEMLLVCLACADTQVYDYSQTYRGSNKPAALKGTLKTWKYISSYRAIHLFKNVEKNHWNKLLDTIRTVQYDAKKQLFPYCMVLIPDKFVQTIRRLRAEPCDVVAGRLCQEVRAARMGAHARTCVALLSNTTFL